MVDVLITRNIAERWITEVEDSIHQGRVDLKTPENSSSAGDHSEGAKVLPGNNSANPLRVGTVLAREEGHVATGQKGFLA